MQSVESRDRERLRKEIPLLGADDDEMRTLFAVATRHRDRYRQDLANLAHYCLFIGYPRSGHSLTAALLDAHPDMVLAHELDVLKFLEKGFDREQISYLMIENARRCAAAGRSWGRYAYAVPGQWQGRHRSIKVLGDKKAGRTTLAIAQDGRRLDSLLKLFGDRLRLVHVVRNPFDIVATLRRIRRSETAETVKSFFFLAQTVADIRQRLKGSRCIDLWHEDLLADPRGQLLRLCSFFGVAAEPDWMEACSSVVNPRPRRSRDQQTWDPDLIQAVETACKRYDFLARYDFET